MRRWTVLVLLAVAFVVGELNPLGWIYWKAAEWKLPRMKEDSLAAASPFESIPPARWLARMSAPTGTASSPSAASRTAGPGENASMT